MTAGWRILMTASLLLLVPAAVADTVQAQPPSISSLSPHAARPGAAVDVRVQGEHLANATGLWTSFPAEIERIVDGSEQAPSEDGKRAVFRLQLPADAPPGVHGLRIVTTKGVSALRLLLVDDLESVAETRPNTTFETAQAISLPAAVDGSVDALARHYYQLEVQQGQTVSFEVFARRFGSPLDPLLRLLDDQGRELAYNDSAAGLMSDSQLCYEFPRAGHYVVELRDVQFQGGGGHRYRLRMGDFPCVNTPYPLAAERGATARIDFAGRHLRGAESHEARLPADPALAWTAVGAKAPGGASSGLATLGLSDRPELLEQEPNDQPANAMRVDLGVNLNGRLDRPGDTDCFVFAAQKGQRYRFSGITRQQGSPTDLYLRLLKADETELAAVDDTGKHDAQLDYTFAADGDYTLVVTDLHRRGGPEFAYRIAVDPYRPGFTLSASTDTLNVPAGGTALLTVTATRQDYSGPIEISAEPLPEGLVVTPAVIGPGLDSTVVTVENRTAAAGLAVPFRLAGTAMIDEQPVRAFADLSAVQQAALNMVWPPLTLSRTLVLGTTDAAPAFTLQADPATVVFGADRQARVRVIATRSEGFQGEIALAVTPEKGGLPPHVSAATGPIPGEADEVEIVFSASEQAVPGEYSVVLLGTGKQGEATTVQAAPAVRLRLEAAED